MITTDFREPGALADGDLRLRLREWFPGDSTRGWVPAYRFDLVAHGEVAGNIELRLGATPAMVRFGGQIGYAVERGHRGRRYAARALRQLFPLAVSHGMTELWITSNPENVASRRTCELAGAEFVDVVDLPVDSDMYAEGERQKCRYRIPLGEHG